MCACYNDKLHVMKYLYKFFISYNRNDAEIARRVADILSVNGISTWFAEAEILIRGRKVLEDQNVLKKILQDAAKHSEFCIYLFSSNSVNSDWINEVELPVFLERESLKTKHVIFPLKIGVIENSFLPAQLGSRAIFSIFNIDRLATPLNRLMSKIKINRRLTFSGESSHSKKLMPIKTQVSTEKRVMLISFDIGIEWFPAGQLSEGMMFFAQNHETGVVLNLMVGIDPAPVSHRSRKVEDIEIDNYFAESYLYGKASFDSRIGNSFLGEREVLGSHVFNINGSPHFAFTYSLKDVIYRKYSILFLPSSASKFFEFVFTASYRGKHEDFLSRIVRVDEIVKSFRVVDHSHSTH